MSGLSPITTLDVGPFFEMSLIDIPSRSLTSVSMVSESSSTTSESVPKPIDTRLFFKMHELEVVRNIMNASSVTSFSLLIAESIATYVTSDENIFGTKEWKEYLGAHIDDTEPPIPVSFYEFWFSQDPFVPDQDPLNPTLNCDTHFPPVLVPKKITYDKTHQPYRLTHLYYLLKKLGEKPIRPDISFPPKEELISNDELINLGFPGIRGQKTSQEATRWVILGRGVYRSDYRENMLKGIYHSSNYQIMEDFNKKYSTTYECYDSDNEAINITTVIFANYVKSGKLTTSFQFPKDHAPILLSDCLYEGLSSKRYFLLKKIVHEQVKEHNTDSCCVVQ